MSNKELWHRDKTEKKCEWCGTNFYPYKDSHKRFCNRWCFYKSQERERDITGKTFNKLTAIKKVGSGNDKSSHWLFRCSCGNECKIKRSSVTNGHTKSCGCYNREVSSMQRAARSPQWLGKEAKPESILRWVNKNYPKDETCYFCNMQQFGNRELMRVPKKDSGYTRNPDDYWIMCMSCLKKGFNKISFKI